MVEEIRRLPKLRIELARDGNSITLIDAEGEPHPFACEMKDHHAAAFREEIKDALDKLKERVKRPVLDVKDASEALETLNRTGLTLIWQIFRERRHEVVRLFQDSFPSWSLNAEPTVITAVAKLSQLIPLEFLPLFELSEWPTCHNLEELEAAARRFPGFSVIIRREFPNTKVNQDLVLQNEPRLPMKCFAEESLAGARSEIQFFKDNNSHIDADGPWPKEKFQGREFQKALAGYLQTANKRFDGKKQTLVDQIQHFTCHCKVDPERAANSMLKLSEGNKVTIAELQEFFAISTEGRPASGPLIFLNACGTASTDPLAVTSFPRFFLEENGNRGFIGSEINVPDAFAAEFSQCFYRGLLKGSTLGKAIHDAKWTLLRGKMNPLGILYTVYADPDLHVSRAVDVVN